MSKCRSAPIFADQFRSAVVLLLVAAAVLAFLFGEYLEAFAIVVVIAHRASLIGAADKLLRQIAVRRLLSGQAAELAEIGAEPCRAGTAWTWDGVRFRLLHPSPGDLWSGNDSSCVLTVENAAGRILLPGDIEARAERDGRQTCVAPRA